MKKKGVILNYKEAESITVKLRDILDAMEKNGMRKAKNTFIGSANADGVIYGACALGQAAINLGVDGPTLGMNLNIHNSSFRSISSVIYDLNDNTSCSLKQIANLCREQFSNELDTSITIDKIYDVMWVD